MTTQTKKFGSQSKVLNVTILNVRILNNILNSTESLFKDLRGCLYTMPNLDNLFSASPVYAINCYNT